VCKNTNKEKNRENMENQNKRIRFKNILISYLDIKNKFSVENYKDFFINLMKKYDNKNYFLIVGQKKQNITVLLLLEKQPNIRNVDIFNMVLSKKKDSNTNQMLEPQTIEKIINIQDEINNIISSSDKYCKFGKQPVFSFKVSEKSRKEQKEDVQNFIQKLKKEFNEDLEMMTDREKSRKELYKS
jgi:hypothetical protein